MARLFNDNSSSDVTFLVGQLKSEFFGHKAIIGSASDVFKAQFSGDWKDSKVITLEDVDEDAFGVVLLYIYTDEIVVREVNLLEVLQLAHFYMLHDLVSALTSEATFSQNGLNHVWKYLVFASEINELDLVIRCLEVIECHTEHTLSLPDFLKLKPTVIALIIGRSSINCDEYKLFCRVHDWSVAECQRRDPPLEATPRNQRKVMESFFRRVRFPLMNSTHFSMVEETGLLNRVEIQQIKTAITSGEKDKTGFDFKPRDGKRRVPVVLEKCYGIMPNVIVRTTYQGKTIDVCIVCALKCHGRISKSKWYPSFGVEACNCKNSGQCVSERTFKPRLPI